MFTTHDELQGSGHAQFRTAALLCCGANLMAASWHMPISRSPFRYAVAVREENDTHAMLLERKSFTLNFLPFAYAETIDMTGRHHAHETDKLQKSGLEIFGEDPFGNRMLQASDFIYSCRVIDTYCNGDHTVFISEVDTIHVHESQSGEPALFAGRGRYATVGPALTVPKA